MPGGGRYALLIGNSEFADPNLARLSAPENDVIALKGVLENEAIAGFETTLVLNAGLVEVQNAVARLLLDRSPDDLILLYYTGHGLRDDHGGLYLALPHTVADVPHATSLDADFVRKVMSQSYSRRQVLILDCCHSGAIVAGSMTAMDAQHAPQLNRTDFDPGGQGRFVLAASAANESAFEVDGRSIFTRHLVEALKTGEAAPDKQKVTINDLHAHLCRRVAEDRAPMQPRLWVDEQTEPLVIARNPNPRKPLPPELVEMLWEYDAPRAHSAAVRLIEICDGDDPQLSADAERVLRQRLEKSDDLLVLVAKPIEDALLSRSTGPDARDERIADLEREIEEAKKALAGERSKPALEAELETARTDAERERDRANKLEQRAGTRYRARNVYVVAAALLAIVGLAVTAGRIGVGDDELADLRARVLELEQTNSDLSISVSEFEGRNSSLSNRNLELERANNSLEDRVAELERTNDGLIDRAASLQTENDALRAQLRDSGAEDDPASLEDLAVFDDCTGCPQMVVLPSGSFQMGSRDGEGESDERPRHPVTVAERFAIARTPVTVAQYAKFVEESGYSPEPGCKTYSHAGWTDDPEASWREPGFDQGSDHPVVCVNWEDAQAYVAWLNEAAGLDGLYRLPSEAEWEYAARAGSVTEFWWDDEDAEICGHANGADASTGFEWSSDCADGFPRTSPVEAFPANGFGLHDMAGNVWHWMADSWHASYRGAPDDGSAWVSGDFSRRVVRGGSWIGEPWGLRSANRNWFAPEDRDKFVGFRPSRTLTP